VDPRRPAVRLLVCARTDVGRARRNNEDACAITELSTGRAIEAFGVDRTVEHGQRGVLLALSDGMGGHQAGEVASALVIESLQSELRSDATVPVHAQLEQAVQRANAVVRAASKSAKRQGMGATLTAVFVRGSEAYIAEVGDSRGYLLRNGRLRQMTRDQSMVQLLVDEGVIAPDEAREAEGKNIILQAVGLDSHMRVAIGRLELRRGDRLMLCSDGVSNQITDGELRQILSDCRPREACETMIALANERGGVDNATTIVADVLGEDLIEPLDFESVTSTFEELQAFRARPSRPAERAMAVVPAPEDEPWDPADEPEISIEEGNPDSPQHQETERKRSWIRSLVGGIRPKH